MHPMALTSLLAITALLVQTGGPVKLAHSYKKDAKTTYALEITIADGQGKVSGDVTFTALDADGNHKVSAPKLALSMQGMEDTREFNADKVKIDAKGLVEQLEFNETGIALILPTVLAYLPGSSIEKDKSFDVKEKRENYTMEGTGKLISLAEKDGKQLATVEYSISIQPNEQSDAGVLKFKSTFEVETGQLVSSEGTAEIGQDAASPFKVKRKA